MHWIGSETTRRLINCQGSSKTGANILFPVVRLETALLSAGL